MDCFFTAQVGPYLDGELTERQRYALESHLAGCSACTQEVRELRQLRDDLRTVFATEAPVAPAGEVAGATTASEGVGPVDSGAVVARLHERAEAMFDGDRGTLRIARILSAVAASVLVAGALWLPEPRRPAPRSAAAWESAALLIPVQSADGSDAAPPAGDLATAEWAVSGLGSTNDWSLSAFGAFGPSASPGVGEAGRGVHGVLPTRESREGR